MAVSVDAGTGVGVSAGSEVSVGDGVKVEVGGGVKLGVGVNMAVAKLRTPLWVITRPFLLRVDTT